jgi:uncharacterized protein (TIGR00730 family)
MDITRKSIRKVLNQKIHQLNDIIADIDVLLTSMENEFYRVCIFGSARIKEDSALYKQAYSLASELSKRGVDIVTGGGPGLMEAANKAAKDVGMTGRSIGLPIELPFESDANHHLDVKHNHRRFSSRLDEFMRISHAVIVTPGGIGTVLELFYTWQLMQVNHIKPRPVILMGEMWDELLVWMKQWPLKENLMSKSDFDHIYICKDVAEVIAILDPKISTFRANAPSATSKIK